MAILPFHIKGCLIILRYNESPAMSIPNSNELTKKGEFHFEITLENKGRLRAFIDRKKGFFILKRIVDIIISLAFISIVLIWLIPVIAIVIAISSGGPVFFRQKRIGLGGRSFYVYKFRTMILNLDSDKIQARIDDRRITRIGKFLRKTNLDELPQFFNVLTGSMSLVGPRPHMHADCTHFSSLIPGYKFRNLVKPGITGMAQIKGFHGPTSDFESIFRRFQWDAFYVRNGNFWIDFRIIRQTAIQSIRNLYTLCVSEN